MAKIYRISSTAGDKVYIGSTIGTLEERWRQHKAPSNDTNSRILFEEYGIETCLIELLEEVKEDESDSRERWWIEFHLTAVNERLPGRSRKEWVVDHKEHLTKYKNEWYQAHKETNSLRYKAYHLLNRESRLTTMRAYSAVKVKCDICNKELSRGSLISHRKSKKHLSKVKLSNE